MARRPTDRQLAQLVRLDDDALLDHALACMCSLRDRAQTLRARGRQYAATTFVRSFAVQAKEIYGVRDAFLVALVEAGIARVERFLVIRQTGDLRCSDCGLFWHADPPHWIDDALCECGSRTARLVLAQESWYIISCRGVRFCQPYGSVTDSVRALAPDVPPRDPLVVEPRGPSSIGLTIEAQRRCVEEMTTRLRRMFAATGIGLGGTA
jgi:hypothetical protein